MGDKSQLKEEVKKILNSILCGYQKGATLKQILNDYDLLTGEPLPLRGLGYSNLEDFIQAIPDAVVTSWEAGQMMVRAVPNEKNQRILNLVSKQKAPKSNRGRGGKGRGGSRGGRGGYSGVYGRSSANIGRSSSYSVRPNSYFSASSRAFSAPNRSTPAPTTVPAFIRQRVNDLLKNFKQGLDSNEFRKAFQRQYGADLNYQDLGFKSFHECMDRMKNIVLIKQCATGHKYYAKQTATVPPRFQSEKKAPQKKRSPNAVKFNVPSLTFTRGDTPTFHGSFGREENVQDEDRGASSKTPFLDSMTSRKASHNTEKSDVTSVTSQVTHNTEIDDVDDSNISVRVKKDIQKVLESNPNGIWANRFLHVYKDSIGRELPFKKLGFQSIVQFMSALPHIVTLKRPAKGDWVLYDARHPLPETQPDTAQADYEVNTKEQTKPSNKMNALNFKKTLRQMLADSATGVYLSDLKEAYKDYSGHEFDYRALGFDSLETLVLDEGLQDVLTPKYVGNGNLLLQGTQNAIPDVTYQQPRKPHNKQRMPHDVVGPGETFEPLLPDMSAPHHFMYVSFVETPGYLWLQLRGEVYSEALERLMDQLDWYKTPESDSYDLPEHLVKTDQIVASTFPEDDNFYRATVTDKRHGDFVEVYYVDYGGTAFVPSDTLKFLKTAFLQLPAQAMLGRLVNLQPVGDTWSAESREFLLNLVRNRPLYTLICGAGEDQVLNVSLCDTNGEKDVFINDLMVERGYARFAPDDESSTQEKQQQTKEKSAEVCNSEASSERLRHSSISTNSITSASELGDEEFVRNVKFVQLTDDYFLHIIKHEDTPYAMSGEISRWFWPQDLLRSRLRKHGRESMDQVILKAEEYPEVFEELMEYKAEAVMDGTELKPHLTLYKLEKVVEILDILEHPVEDLKMAVQKAIEEFDPSEPYWRGEDEEDDESLDVADLEMALKQLDLQRKKILVNLNEDPENSTSHVDSLDQVERRFVKVRGQLKVKQGHDEVQDGFTAEEKMIQECVTEQYSSTTEAKSMAKSQTRSQKRISPSPTRQIQTNTVAPMPSSSQSKSIDVTSSNIPVTSATDVHHVMTSLNLGNNTTSASGFNPNAPVFTSTNASSTADPNDMQNNQLFQAQLMMSAQMFGGYPQLPTMGASQNISRQYPTTSVRNPVARAGNPANVTGNPGSVAGNPGIMAGNPGSVAGNPGIMAGNPGNIAGSIRNPAMANVPMPHMSFPNPPPTLQPLAGHSLANFTNIPPPTLQAAMLGSGLTTGFGPMPAGNLPTPNIYAPNYVDSVGLPNNAFILPAALNASNMTPFGHVTTGFGQSNQSEPSIHSQAPLGSTAFYHQSAAHANHQQNTPNIAQTTRYYQPATQLQSYMNHGDRTVETDKNLETVETSSPSSNTSSILNPAAPEFQMSGNFSMASQPPGYAGLGRGSIYKN